MSLSEANFRSAGAFERWFLFPGKTIGEFE